MLQEVMHSHSISVVEEAVLDPNQQAVLTPAGTSTQSHTHLVHQSMNDSGRKKHEESSVHMKSVGYKFSFISNLVPTRVQTVLMGLDPNTFTPMHHLDRFYSILAS